VRDSYNAGALSFSPAELAATIRSRVPTFDCHYEPDERQHIAENWPSSVDDGAARTDWGWAPEYDLEATTEDMLSHLRAETRKSGSVDA